MIILKSNPPKAPTGPPGPALPPFRVADGHNNSIWARARLCRNHGLQWHTTHELIDAWITQNCHLFKRAIPAHEVEQQIRNAYSYAGTPPGGDKEKRVVAPPAPAGGDVKLTEFIEQSFADFGVNELKLEHPPGDLRDYSPIDFLHTLFCEIGEEPFNPWVCLGKTHKGMQTIRLQYARHREVHGERFADFQFVVPNPMRKETGTTLDGRTESWRCRDNAILESDRIFYIVEYDLDGKGVPVSKDVQARRLWCLSVFFQDRLCLVVDTGGKSLHGWFKTKGLAYEDRELFWKLALATGADPAGARPEQFFRMPNGMRAPKTKEGASTKQEVLYFNPQAGRGTR